MTKIKLSAFSARQNGYSIYIGVCKASDLVQFTTVDYYDSKLEISDPKQGYQRPPEQSRIASISKFLLDQQDHLLFPTSILLASRIPMRYESEKNTLEINSDNPLQVIDGQHRIAGIKHSLQKKNSEKIHDLDIPFVIIETEDKVVEMNQFRIINSNAKSVRTDLVNMILTNMYKDKDRKDIPIKDQWKVVVTNVVVQLAKDKSSPWYDNIVLPDEAKSNNKIMRATSFITSLRPVYQWLKDIVMDVKYTTLEQESEYMYSVVSEYWKAIKELNPKPFEDPDNFVIQKSPGLFSLHKLLRLLLNNMYKGRREYTSENFQEFLKESPEIIDSNFWYSGDTKTNEPGGTASTYGSMKGFEVLYKLISTPFRD